MTMEAAKKAVAEAVYQVKLAQAGLGRGPGAREAAVAATKGEEMEMWLQRAEERGAASEEGEG